MRAFAALLMTQLAAKVFQILLALVGVAGLVLSLANAALFACVYVGLACLWACWSVGLPSGVRSSVLAVSFASSFFTRTFGYLAFPAGELLTAATPALSALCALAAWRFSPVDRMPCGFQPTDSAQRRRQFHRALEGMPGLLAIFLVIAALARPLAFGPLDGGMLSPALSFQDVVSIALGILVLACCRLGAGTASPLRLLWPAATVILFAGLFLMANADEGLIGAGKQIMIVGRTMLGLLLWMLLASVAAEGRRDPVVCLALPFVAVDALSSLLGYVALPGLFGLAGLTASELGATLASAITFALVAVSVLVFARAMGTASAPAGFMGAEAHSTGGASDGTTLQSAQKSDSSAAQAAGTAAHAADIAFEPAHGLTEREEQVATLLAQGNSQRRIAELMGVSIGTVQTHIKAVYRKLGIHSKQELIDRTHGL